MCPLARVEISFGLLCHWRFHVIVGLDQLAESEASTSALAYYALVSTVDPAIYERFAAAATADAVEHGARLGDQPMIDHRIPDEVFGAASALAAQVAALQAVLRSS